MPSWERSANTSHRSRPKTRIGASSPLASGYCCSVSSLTSVDLPAPFGPKIAVCWPSGIVSVSRSRTRASPSTTLASRSSTSGGATLFRNRPRAELAIEIEDRRGVVLHQPELGDDLARRFFLFHLLGEEPLQLGHLGKGLLLEAQLVEGVDLRGHPLLVGQRLLEDGAKRVEGQFRLVDRVQLDFRVAGKHEVEQFQPVLPFLVALHPQPFRGAEKFLLFAEAGHRQVGIGGFELRV